jgi:hypothetical protein
MPVGLLPLVKISLARDKAQGREADPHPLSAASEAPWRAASSQILTGSVPQRLHELARARAVGSVLKPDIEPANSTSSSSIFTAGDRNDVMCNAPPYCETIHLVSTSVDNRALA